MKNIFYLESVLKMPMMKLPVRSVFIKTANKGLLISPGSKLNSEDFQKLENVTDIVAPNLFHLDGIPKAQSHFPNAKIWGPIGAEKKRPDINWDYILDENSWPFKDEVGIVFLQGMDKVNEYVFIHKESRTLIVADLAFNMIHTKGLGPFLILSLFGTYNKFAVSKFFLRQMSDRNKFSESLAKLFNYHFDAIAVSHGEIVDSNGEEILRSALKSRGFDCRVRT